MKVLSNKGLIGLTTIIIVTLLFFFVVRDFSPPTKGAILFVTAFVIPSTVRYIWIFRLRTDLRRKYAKPETSNHQDFVKWDNHMQDEIKDRLFTNWGLLIVQTILFAFWAFILFV